MARINMRVGLTPSMAALKNFFERGLVEATDWKPLWPRIAANVVASTKANIASRGATLSAELTYGHVWKPADPRYLRRKAREGRGAVDLYYTGRLVKQVTTLSGVKKLSPKYMVFGTRRLKYAQKMNFVKRPFMGATSELTNGIAELMVGHLSEVTHRACRATGRGR